MSDKNRQVRDYSLVGEETPKAIELGLADADWYQSPVPRDKMRELLVRKDGPAIRDTLIWFGLIFGSAYLVYFWWGSWFVIFPYFVYSVLYASTSDSRWHESSHGTAFKTDWMNNVLYEISSFMVFRQSTVWRWSHARHHSDTIIRGRDPEISVPRPPKISKIIRGFLGLSGSVAEIRRLFLHAGGKIDPEVATYLPESENRIVIIKARIFLLILFVVIASSIYFQTILPLMYIGIPTIVGSWLMRIYGMTQHAGLQENVLDHRLNSRTVYMNRIHRFLYWNMNYHVEHHMYPLVPYHALPKLHELVKDDCPKPYKSITHAFREIIPAIRKQIKDPGYFVDRELPEGAGILGELKKEKDRVVRGKIVNDKIEVGNISQLAKGEVIRFDFEKRTYAIYRTLKDVYYASDGICTHGNSHLSEGVVIDEMIECPKHNGRFALRDGSPQRIPVCVGINTYTVEINSGKIYLNLKEVRSKANKEQEANEFRVVENRNVATFIKELELKAVNGNINYQPGQYIHLEIPPHHINFNDLDINEPHRSFWTEQKVFQSWSKNEVHSKRNYSMAGNPEKETNLKFNIRIALSPNPGEISAGTGSSYAFSLKPGDTINLSGPYGDFLIKDTDREMVYLGGGAGMAPIRSHLSWLFETKMTKRNVSFWYGARSLNDLFYRDYFQQMEKSNKNFTYKVALSEPGENDKWNGERGFIHEYLLNNYLSKHKNPKEVEYYLCGPPAMIQAGLKMLSDLGISDKMIAYDEF